MVINDKIKCLCINSSYTGKHCEITKLKPITTTTRTTTTFELAATTTSTDYDTPRDPFMMMMTTESSPSFVPTHLLTLKSGSANKHAPLTSSPRVPFHTNKQITPTTRAYFWQCPSNCFYSLGRGFCALSQSGYPHCVCHIGWTGIDCSQKNFCAENDCNNNATCVNFPERRYTFKFPLYLK